MADVRNNFIIGNVFKQIVIVVDLMSESYERYQNIFFSMSRLRKVWANIILLILFSFLTFFSKNFTVNSTKVTRLLFWSGIFVSSPFTQQSWLYKLTYTTLLGLSTHWSWTKHQEIESNSYPRQKVQSCKLSMISSNTWTEKTEGRLEEEKQLKKKRNEEFPIPKIPNVENQLTITQSSQTNKP